MNMILTKQKTFKVECQWIYKKKKKIFWLKNKYFDWNISDINKFYKLENSSVAVLAFQKKMQDFVVIRDFLAEAVEKYTHFCKCQCCPLLGAYRI